MRPINLKIKGINSYVSEQEVCFDKLSETNLFGIFGETGSGKSTILDAIIIALYGSSDRETIQNIINVNSKEAHIKFMFDMVTPTSTKHYLVTREYKVRKSGVKSDAILLDQDTNEVLAEMTDKVNDKILQIIGVGKKEFLKCIALPQGEFDNFLLDTPANRKKTIAKLFNLENFGANLQEKLKIRRDIATLEKLSLQEKISIYGEVGQEKIDLLVRDGMQKEAELKDLRKQIIAGKMQYEVLSNDYDAKLKLLEAVSQLALKKSEQNEIEYLKKQVEYSKKYGEYILLYNKLKTYESECDNFTTQLKNYKDKLIVKNTSIDKNTEKQNKLNDRKKEVEKLLKALQSAINQYNELSIKIENCSHKKNELVEEVASLEESVTTLKKNLNEYKSSIQESSIEYKKLEKAIFDNMDILDKIREVKALQTTEGFLDYLGYLRGLVTPDALQEVYQYDIYEEINKLMDSINDYDLQTRKDIAELQQDYRALLRYNSSLEDLQSKLEAKNNELNLTCDKIEENIEDSKRIILVSETQIVEKETLIQNYKLSIKNLDVEIANYSVLIKNLKGIDKYKNLEEENLSITSELEQVSVEIKEATDERNNLLVNIELNTFTLSSFKEQLADVKKQIKKLGITGKTEDEIEDINLYLPEEDVEVAEGKIKEFENELNVLETKVKEYKQLVTNEDVSKELVKNALDNLTLLEEKERNLSVDLALNKQILIQVKENTLKVKELEDQLQKALKKLDVIATLSGLLSNNALLDYVSEEYMYLITQFANKYVYDISKGKYLLKYDGEFYVLDNFNGGIARGVKTLSGGERFIISLSLALGISQSIAVNNNTNFNFFFIDEGFGSLSEGYVENVLQAFDTLIKLDFTVGFISHVEKMQNYINNRIIVTKKNNDEGSVIKQYF